MRLGVNYPHGPIGWGESLGWGRVLRLLENLQQHYGEERYRPSALLREKRYWRCVMSNEAAQRPRHV